MVYQLGALGFRVLYYAVIVHSTVFGLVIQAARAGVV